MPNDNRISRRAALQVAGAGALAGLAGGRLPAAEPVKLKGNVKHSVCYWCYNNKHVKVPLEKFAAEAVKAGYKSVELLQPEEYKVVKPFGLTCAMIESGHIKDGLNRKENHAKWEKILRTRIDFAAEEKLPNVICFSGNRAGLADDEGMKNCAAGIKKVLALAEQKKITLCLELLNSKVNHKDYMGDHMGWGVALVKMVGSPRFKLLYDIYHMQIMDGDIIATIQANKEHIAHYHTGGVPGRHEIDDTQELNYPAIVRAILATGYKGYLGQEYIPAREPIASLAQGLRICDV